MAQLQPYKEEAMTAKELKEALANVPDDAEVYMDDGCSVNAIPTDYAEYTEEYNIFMIH